MNRIRRQFAFEGQPFKYLEIIGLKVSNLTPPFSITFNATGSEGSKEVVWDGVSQVFFVGDVTHAIEIMNIQDGSININFAWAVKVSREGDVIDIYSR